MAKIFPNIVEDFHSSYGEFQIFEALKKLNDDWYIFHSLNWQQRNKNGRITWGEADFVIFNKVYGILVIEVKSGGISFSEGEWYQTRIDNNEINKMKNPFNQANRSKYKLIDEIDFNLSHGGRCFVDKAVWFPSISAIDLEKINLPLEFNKRLILTGDSLKKPLESIISIYNFYNSFKFTSLTEENKKRVLSILQPNFNLVPSASNIKDETDYIFYQLTNEQKKVLDFVEDQQSIAIQGSAGTGKTFIAVEQAKRLAVEGKVLFLCFNKFLYMHLKNKCIIDNVDYYNLHTFLSKYSTDDLLTDEKCLYALKNIDINALGYDSIIIDEAQDINNKIINYLFNYALDRRLKFIIFYDKNQMLFQNELPKCLESFDCKLSLNKNCRNTIKILQTVNSIFNGSTDANHSSISGVMPSICFNEIPLRKLEEIIEEYLNEGYTVDDITILTLSTENNSILSEFNYIGKYKISGEKKDNNIFFTTSKKFKGLESNIVIVVDFDAKKYDDYEYKKNFYVSLSRARQRLSILCNKNDDLKILASLIEGNLDDTIKVARKFKVKIDK